MAAPIVSFRVPAALLALIDAAASRAQRSRTDEILDALALRYMGEDTAPAPKAKAAPKPRAPLPPIIKASALPDAPKAAPVERAAVGRGGAAMANAGVMVWNGEKRPIYQKGGPAKAKGGRR